MKIYVTRHGQVSHEAEYFNGDVSLPIGEVVLSELGKEQARLLGEFLKKRGFRGDIYASPLLRTMQTAEIIAEITGSVIIPTPWIHEIFMQQAFLDEYQGFPLDQLREYFPHLSKTAPMEYPWWPKTPENTEIVRARVRAGLDTLLQRKDTDEEILLVGHGASAGAVNWLLKLKPGGMLWNCSLGMYDTKDPNWNFGKNVSFLPGKMVSTNQQMAVDYPFAEDCTEPLGIHVPMEIREEKGLKLLHIGDTHSATYTFYKQLIHLTKPDVIIHTGDTADELKVGWDVSARPEYLEQVKMLMDILKASGSEVYWVPGNNDLPEEIAKMAPFVHIVQPDTVVEIGGQRVCLAHSQEQITQEADIYLYGHGRRRTESFDAEMRHFGGDSLTLNVMWKTYVLILPERKLYQIERPD